MSKWKFEADKRIIIAIILGVFLVSFFGGWYSCEQYIKYQITSAFKDFGRSLIEEIGEGR